MEGKGLARELLAAPQKTPLSGGGRGSRGVRGELAERAVCTAGALREPGVGCWLREPLRDSGPRPLGL